MFAQTESIPGCMAGRLGSSYIVIEWFEKAGLGRLLSGYKHLDYLLADLKGVQDRFGSLGQCFDTASLSAEAILASDRTLTKHRIMHIQLRKKMQLEFSRV